MRQYLTFFIIASLASGCGVLLDLDPPDDAGFDGQVGRRDGGPQCMTDDDCPIDSVCDGVPVCAFGECISGTPVVCDDGIDCTEDRCDRSRGCVARPRHSECSGASSECAVDYCDTELGCQVRFDDTACDDGIGCTLDLCDEGSCSSTSDHGSCPVLQYCELDPGDGSPGCRDIPDSCLMDSDCIPLPCNTVSCDSDTNTCVYEHLSIDAECTVSDHCRPATCSEGVCTIGEAVTCAPGDRAVCNVEECVRDEAGDVDCVPAPRTGPCSTMDCFSGSCTLEGRCEESFICPESPDLCQEAICSGRGCTFASITCSANATCVATATDAACVCDAGFHRCADGTVGCCVDLADAGLGGVDGGGGGFDAGGFDAGGFDAGGFDAGGGGFDAGGFDAGGFDAGGGGFDAGGFDAGSTRDGSLMVVDAEIAAM